MKKYISFGIFILAVLFSSCENNDTVFSADGLMFESFKGEYELSYDLPAQSNEDEPLTIRLNEPLDCTVESDAEWCHLLLELKESLYVKVTLDENYDDADRKANIIVKSKYVKEPMNIVINQMKPVRSDLEAVNLTEGLNPEGEERTIRVYSKKGDWTIQADKQWIGFSPKSGTTTGDTGTEVKMTVPRNSEGTLRPVKITLQSGDNKVDYELVQEASAFTDQKVGDSGVTFNEDLIDPRYEKLIREYIKAGVDGGIPSIEEEKIIRSDMPIKEFSPGDNVLKEINEYTLANSGKKIIVYLKNGEYTFTTWLRVYSNQMLLGESQEGVIINLKDGGQITLMNADNAAVKNITLKGQYKDTPPVDTKFETTISGKGDFRTMDLQGAQNCYVDDVTIINSASHPLYLTKNYGTERECMYNTIRNVTIDGAYNKGEGCQGYFMIQGHHNLITGCKVTNIRHISMQERITYKNVLYKNDFEQEVTFHHNDAGDNLVENNNITIPANMGGYYAIMGPWSTQHWIGEKNYIYRNKCLEKNHSNKRPWSDDTKLYMGPLKRVVGGTAEQRYEVFEPLSSYPAPTGKTFYPVILK